MLGGGGKAKLLFALLDWANSHAIYTRLNQFIATGGCLQNGSTLSKDIWFEKLVCIGEKYLIIAISMLLIYKYMLLTITIFHMTSINPNTQHLIQYIHQSLVQHPNLVHHGYAQVHNNTGIQSPKDRTIISHASFQTWQQWIVWSWYHYFW